MYLLEQFQYQTNTSTPYNQGAFLSTLGLTHMWGIPSHRIIFFVSLYIWGFCSVSMERTWESEMHRAEAPMIFFPEKLSIALPMK